MNYILSIYSYLSSTTRSTLICFVIVSLALVPLEMATILLVVPLISGALDSHGSEFVASLALPLIFGKIDIRTTAILFSCIALTASVFRFLSQRLVASLSAFSANDFAREVFRGALSEPYEIHANRNSSEVLTAVSNSSLVGSYLSGMATLSSSILSAISVLYALSTVSIITLLLIVASACVVYLPSAYVVARVLKECSLKLASQQVLLTQKTQEALGSIRDIKLSGLANLYADEFGRNDFEMRDATRVATVYSSVPRIVLDCLAYFLIAVTVYVFSASNSSAGYWLPVAGSFLVGIQRLVPSLQSSFSTFANLRLLKDRVSATLSFAKSARISLNWPESSDCSNLKPDLSFADSLTLDTVCFSYASRPEVQSLKEISLTIKPGEFLGIFGETGSGKSTLLDMISGLLSPVSGKIIVDASDINLNQRTLSLWRKKIAYVPQHVFLTDDTIAANIALGGDVSDFSRIYNSARLAQIHQFISSLPQGYETRVGERGVQLSGGQRQRIGIARALFLKKQVLILDEATSALDYSTESRVVEAIRSCSANGTTLIVVAHRVSTLYGCDRVICLDKGRVTADGPPSEVLVQS